MEVESKVISTQTIKPSSPTPKSLQIHHLSFLDQLMPPLLSPIVFFYSPNPKIPNSEKSKQLKKSLSEILSIYYPLAGRLAGNLHVDCNDAGAPFFEAEADCHLSQVVTNPNPRDLQKFLPFKDEPRDLCMAVQATYFRCGGLAVGLLISHKIADAVSFFSFVNSWSAVARNGGGSIPLPKFDVAAYFPPREISGFQPTRGMVNEEAAVGARFFTFPASKIAALQERYSTADAAAGRRPSRVKALLAYIWTGFVSTTSMRSDPNKVYTLVQSVNLRTRVDPPLSEYHFGNLFGLSAANTAAGESGAEVLRKMREAVKAVDGGYVARLKKGENFRKQIILKGEPVSFSFNSLCGFPLYEADFGWGRPVWVGHGGFPYKNLAFFMDTKSGDGIEVLIHLTKQDMEKFEAYLELQTLKSNL